MLVLCESIVPDRACVFFVVPIVSESCGVVVFHTHSSTSREERSRPREDRREKIEARRAKREERSAKSEEREGERERERERERQREKVCGWIKGEVGLMFSWSMKTLGFFEAFLW